MFLLSNILPEEDWRVWSTRIGECGAERKIIQHFSDLKENFILVSNALYRAENTHGHILQSKNLLQTFNTKNSLHIYLSFVFYRFLL